MELALDPLFWRPLVTWLLATSSSTCSRAALRCWPTEFALEDFCSSLFDGFFLTASPRKENVHRHALRLLIHLHPRVAPSKLEALQKALEPTGQSGEAVKELYSQLGEKLEQLDHRKPSPAQAAETPALELPLPSVPAPAPL
ncbi:hypothetical protein H8959_012479 [Pygathrix nigripes]